MNKFFRATKNGSGLGAVSIFALMAASPQIAIAQNNDTASKGETVVITGLRGSLTKSIKIKKENASIVEVISAEEIGKLPDSSIAESLARLPGIAGQRVNGDVQVINLRGTSPDFTVTTFNGRLQGSLGDGRGVEIDQYPSELINGVVVYKTPDSSVAGQGLSGTVDLRGIRPLSQAGKSMILNVRADTSNMDELNPEAKKWGGRATFSYVNQYMDGKLGVAFGLAYSDTTRQTQHQKLWNWRPASTGNSGILPGKTAAEQASLMPTGFEIRALSNHKVRTGMMGVIEYQPNDNSHTTADLYYSKYKQDEYLRGIEMLSEWGVDGFSVPSGTITDVGGSKFLSQYVLAGGYPILNNQVHTRDDSVLSGGINHKFKSRNWDMEVDASYSKAEGDAANVQIIGGYGANRTGDTLNIGVGLDDFSSIDPSLNYADASKIYLGDNAPWGGWGQEGFRQLPHIEDSYAGLDFKAKTSLEDTFLSGLFGSFEVGVNFSAHEKIKSSTDEDLCLKSAVASTGIGQDGGNQCVPGSGTSTRRRSASPITSIGTADLSFGGFGGLAAFDILSTMNSMYNILQRKDSNAYNRNWSLKEDIFTAFTRLNIDSNVFGKRLRGNIGVQFIDTATQSTGFAITGASNNPGNAGFNAKPILRTIDNSYTDVLPSLNLSYDVLSNMKIRFGAAKQMARPRPDQLRASVNASLSLASNNSSDPNFGKYRWGGDVGNPKLDPWRANSYDVSLEMYLKGGLIAVSGFYKDVETYIYNQAYVFDFTGVPNPNNLPLVSNFGQINVMQNGQGGYIKGIEVQATLDFGKYVSVLDGFGFTGSYSHNYTDISPDGPSSSNTLPGFSGESRNLTAFYEKHGFQLRISERWRSAFRSDTAGLFADRTFSEILEDKQVDAQIGYQFSDGPFEGMSLLLQANNLTDSPYRTRTGATTSNGLYLPETYDKYGTQYLFGIRYKF